MAIEKLIIDTDPGIDDAMAIIMAVDAHKRKEIEIVAITLVNGNCEIKHSQVNVMRILETCGVANEILVFKGAEKAMVVEYGKSEVAYHGVDGFNNVEFDSAPNTSMIKGDPACKAIVRIVRENRGT